MALESAQLLSPAISAIYHDVHKPTHLNRPAPPPHDEKHKTEVGDVFV